MRQRSLSLFAAGFPHKLHIPGLPGQRLRVPLVPVPSPCAGQSHGSLSRQSPSGHRWGGKGALWALGWGRASGTLPEERAGGPGGAGGRRGGSSGLICSNCFQDDAALAPGGGEQLLRDQTLLKGREKRGRRAAACNRMLQCMSFVTPPLEDVWGSVAAGRLRMVLPYRAGGGRERMLGGEEGSAQTASSTSPTAPRQQGRCQDRGCRCLLAAPAFRTPPGTPGTGPDAPGSTTPSISPWQ